MSETPGTSGQPVDQRSRHSVPQPATMTKDQAVPGAAASPFAALRGIAFRGYRWLLLGFLLLGVAQIFLAGLGVFRLQDQGLAAGGDSAFAPHRAIGFTMAGIALLILVLAVIARPGTRAIIGSAVLVLRPRRRKACSRASRIATRSTALCMPSTGCSSLASPGASMPGHAGASHRGMPVTGSRGATATVWVSVTVLSLAGAVLRPWRGATW